MIRSFRLAIADPYVPVILLIAIASQSMATSILYTLLDIQIPLPRYVKYLEQWQLEAEHVSRRIFGFDRGLVRSI
jgi:hypothetical protein